jgi:hypothetical protein
MNIKLNSAQNIYNNEFKKKIEEVFIETVTNYLEYHEFCVNELTNKREEGFSHQLKSSIVCLPRVYLSLVVSPLYITGDSPSAKADCETESACPSGCKCAAGVVNCRERGLENVPQLFPEDSTEL